jgi:hypothetical protein
MERIKEMVAAYWGNRKNSSDPGSVMHNIGKNWEQWAAIATRMVGL